MTPRSARSFSDAHLLQRVALLFGAVTLLASCDNNNGPRTGKLSLTVVGLPTGTSAQVTLSGPNNFSRVLTASDIVANLKPGDYAIKAASIRDGLTRYSPLTDSQTVTITKSNVPVAASVAYAVSSAVLTVTVNGAPTADPAAVRVTGPNGFNQTIAATTTFAGIDPGIYLIVAPEILSNQQRFAASPGSRQVQLSPGLNPTTIPVVYAQITGNITFAVAGLPTGVTANISVSGPAASYVVGTSSDLVGVRAGQYTVNVNPVTSNGALYVPNFTVQTITLSAAATLVVTVNYVRSDGPLNLTIDAVTITESVQTYAQTVPLVAGRDAFIRVFARANQPNNVAPDVRVRLYVNDVLVNTMVLAKASGVPISPDQAAIGSSWNGIVDRQFIQPGLKILADVDPTNAVVEASETDNSFPTSGTPLAIDVRNVAPLRITFVPVVQRFDKSLVGNVSDTNADQFLGDARRMLPLLDIDAQVHAPYTTADSLELTSNDGNSEWLRVLSEMNALRVAESSVRHYFGVVKVSYNSGVAGYGYVPGRAVVGWDYLPTGRNVAAHELTHNFGRLHAPCGGVAGPDPNYPYAGGTIGVYGYDLSNNTLKLPSAFDLMGYCSNPWISDYNYVGAMDWRAANPTPDVTSAAGQTTDASARPTLLVWGRVEGGQLVLEPAFSLVTRPSVPRESGPYRVEGIARNGRTLFSYSFAGERPADAPDPSARHFAFAIPMDVATQGELASIRLTGVGAAPASMQASLAPGGVSAAINTVDATASSSGSVRVQWGATGVRMALIRDRRTGQVLSFARGAGAQIRTPSADLDVIVSDGVRSVSRAIRVSNR
jgi:hypothetical protein